MTAISAPEVTQVAPDVTTRVREGDLAGGQRNMLGLGVVALLATLAGYFVDHEQFLFSYLAAYMFALSLCLGALGFVMIQHITRAGWSVVVRRVAENVMAVLPVMAVLFIPIAVGYHTLYHHWIDAPAEDTVIAGKSGYLNVPFFFVRAVLYFAIWIGLSRYFYKNSVAQDQSGDPEISLRLSRRAAPGILLFALSLTFAAFDWIMSLDPHWFSTMFGVTYFAGAMMSFLALLGLLCMWLRGKGYLGSVVTVEHYHDIGKLLFAFMVFWTYVNFSQYFLIWYANLPEETAFYAHRMDSSWEYIGILLVVGHFLVPFAFMMSRHIKRNTKTLAFSAIFLLVMHWFDMQYLVLPNMAHEGGHGGFHPTWIDATALIGMLALVIGLTIRNMARSPLVPERDPRLAESVHFHNI